MMDDIGIKALREVEIDEYRRYWFGILTRALSENVQLFIGVNRCCGVLSGCRKWLMNLLLVTDGRDVLPLPRELERGTTHRQSCL